MLSALLFFREGEIQRTKFHQNKVKRLDAQPNQKKSCYRPKGTLSSNQSTRFSKKDVESAVKAAQSAVISAAEAIKEAGGPEQRASFSEIIAQEVAFKEAQKKAEEAQEKAFLEARDARYASERAERATEIGDYEGFYCENYGAILQARDAAVKEAMEAREKAEACAREVVTAHPLKSVQGALEAVESAKARFIAASQARKKALEQLQA